MWRGAVVDGLQASGIVGALLPCENKPMMDSSEFARGGFVSKDGSEVVGMSCLVTGGSRRGYGQVLQSMSRLMVKPALSRCCRLPFPRKPLQLEPRCIDASWMSLMPVGMKKREGCTFTETSFFFCLGVLGETTTKQQPNNKTPKQQNHNNNNKKHQKQPQQHLKKTTKNNHSNNNKNNNDGSNNNN